MAKGKGKKVIKEKAKKSTAAATASAASSATASPEGSDNEQENEEQPVDTGDSGDAAMNDDDDEIDDVEEDDDGDDESGSSRKMKYCKHAGKHVKAIRAKLKTLPKLLEEADTRTKSKEKSKDKKAAKKKSSSSTGDDADAPSCWVCSTCGVSDSSKTPKHFVKKHDVGIELFSMTWHCFQCKMDLNETTVKPAAWKGLKDLTSMIETTIGTTTKRSAIAAAKAVESERRKKEVEEYAQAIATSSPSSGSALIQPKGLRNLGNTCFFNSVVQCFAATTPLYGHLCYPSSSLYDSNAISMAHPIQNAFYQFLQSMAKPVSHDPTNKKPGKLSKYDGALVISPSSLLSSIQALNPMFRGSRQHDSHELLRTVLNGICLEKEEETRKKKQAIAAAVVKTWSVEHVYSWIESWPLPSEVIQIIISNISCDTTNEWDGAFILRLIDNWASKAMKQPRIILHGNGISKDDQRIMARQLQRIKDGNLPDSSVWLKYQQKKGQNTEEKSSAEETDATTTIEPSITTETPSADVPVPLHPFETLLQSTFVHSIFGGVLRNSVECLACHTISVTHEYFLDLSLAIEAPKIIVQKSSSSSTKTSSSSKSTTSFGQSPKAISKQKGKHLSKQQKKALRRKMHAGGKNKQEEEHEEAEEGEEDEEEDEKVDEHTEENNRDGSKKVDSNVTEEKKDDEEAKAIGTTTSPAADESKIDEASSSIIGDAASAASSTTETATPISKESLAASSDALVSSILSDTVAELTQEVEKLTLTNHSSELTTPSSSTITEKSTTPNCSVNSSSIAISDVSNVPISPATAFLEFVRHHHLGFARLSSARATLADCLGAFTDPDLLTGANKYGCKECSNRAQAAGLSWTVSPPPPTNVETVEEEASPEAESKAESTQPETETDPLKSPTAVSEDSTLATTATADDDSTSATAATASTGDETTLPSTDASADPTDAATSGVADSSAVSSPPPVDESIPIEREPSPSPPPLWIKQDAIKRCQILIPPQVLTLHLKRFHASGRSMEKSSKGVDFPLCFNLADYMTPTIPSDSIRPFVFDGPSPLSNLTERPCDTYYHLYGIVSHGGGMGGGHYVSYVRRQNLVEVCANDGVSNSHAPNSCQLDAIDLTKNWYYCSDSDVRPVSVNEVLKVQAYLLFYVKA